MQRIIENNTQAIDTYFREVGTKKLLLVAGKSADGLEIGKYFRELESRTGIQVVRFSDFKPNPDYRSALSGVALYKETGCDMVAAIGGGSAMDTAKCIKMYVTMDTATEYIDQTIVPNDIEFFAVPTTAGTGSEATRYAIIYHNGSKVSVTDNSCIPTAVMFAPDTLKSLPEYHKKAAMLDALCHAVESYWSVHSTDESKRFASEAIEEIIAAKDSYLANTDEGCRKMLFASNTAGKAINITATTAGHAMCYKLTTRHGLAHGHAAALCVKALFSYMVRHTELCSDPRGEEYFRNTLDEIAKCMGCNDAASAAEKFGSLVDELGMNAPKVNKDEIAVLTGAVAPDRLKNHPIRLDSEIISKLYTEMLVD